MSIDLENLPDRETLIAICHDGLVVEDKWRNRDSSGAQIQLAKAGALLRAGCSFTYDMRMTSAKGNKDTLCIEIEYKGFNWFEGTMDPEDPRQMNEDHFYLPTYERLERVAGGDWY